MIKYHKFSFLTFSLWLNAIFLIIVFTLPIKDILSKTLLFVSVLVAVTFFSYLQSKTFRLEVTQRELVFKRGFLFIQQKRIPLRFITSFNIIQTPLQRCFKQATVIVCTSGSISLLIGLSLTDAENINTQIAQTGGGYL